MNSILILRLPALSDLRIESIIAAPSGLPGDHAEAASVTDGANNTQTQPTAGIPDRLRGVDSDVKLGTVPRK